MIRTTPQWSLGTNVNGHPFGCGQQGPLPQGPALLHQADQLMSHAWNRPPERSDPGWLQPSAHPVTARSQRVLESQIKVST
jgi:hypothetical protein